MGQSQYVDLREFKSQIKALKKATGGAAIRSAMLAGGGVVEAEAKANIKKQGLIDEGRLRASIEAKAITDLEVVIGTNVIYAAIHEFGGVITPKTAKYLRFYWEKIGQWVVTKSVTIPARPYLRPALDNSVKAIERAIKAVLLFHIEKILK